MSKFDNIVLKEISVDSSSITIGDEVVRTVKIDDRNNSVDKVELNQVFEKDVEQQKDYEKIIHGLEVEYKQKILNETLKIKNDIKNQNYEYSQQLKKNIEIFESLTSTLKNKVEEINLMIEPMVSNLTIIALRKIVGDSYEYNQMLISAIKDTILKHNIVHNICIKVSSSDFDSINELIDAEKLNDTHISITKDINLDSGKVIIDTDCQVVEISLNDRIDKIEGYFNEK